MLAYSCPHPINVRRIVTSGPCLDIVRVLCLTMLLLQWALYFLAQFLRICLPHDVCLYIRAVRVSCTGFDALSVWRFARRRGSVCFRLSGFILTNGTLDERGEPQRHNLVSNMFLHSVFPVYSKTATCYVPGHFFLLPYHGSYHDIRHKTLYAQLYQQYGHGTCL